MNADRGIPLPRVHGAWRFGTLALLAAGLSLVLGTATMVSAQAVPTKVITLKDNGKTLHAEVDQTIAVNMGPGTHITSLNVAPGGVLEQEDNPPGSDYQAYFLAVADGAATMTIEGTLPCATTTAAPATTTAASPPCPTGTPPVFDVNVSIEVGGHATGDWGQRIEGKPANIEAGAEGGYYFWHDGQGLHLWVTDPENIDSHYTGTIATDGTYSSVNLEQPEGDDSYQQVGAGELQFNLHTQSGIDGLDFTIDGGSYVRLDLYRDGNLTRTDHIWLGANSVNPEHNPLEAQRH